MQRCGNASARQTTGFATNAKAGTFLCFTSLSLSLSLWLCQAGSGIAVRASPQLCLRPALCRFSINKGGFKKHRCVPPADAAPRAPAKIRAVSALIKKSLATTSWAASQAAAARAGVMDVDSEDLLPSMAIELAAWPDVSDHAPSLSERLCELCNVRFEDTADAAFDHNFSEDHMLAVRCIAQESRQRSVARRAQRKEEMDNADDEGSASGSDSDIVLVAPRDHGGALDNEPRGFDCLLTATDDGREVDIDQEVHGAFDAAGDAPAVWTLPIVEGDDSRAEELLSDEQGRKVSALVMESHVADRTHNLYKLIFPVIPSIYKIKTALNAMAARLLPIVDLTISVPFQGCEYAFTTAVFDLVPALLFKLSDPAVLNALALCPQPSMGAFEHVNSPYFTWAYNCFLEQERALGTGLPVGALSLSTFLDDANICSFADLSLCPISFNVLNQAVHLLSGLDALTVLVGYCPKWSSFDLVNGQPPEYSNPLNSPDFRRLVCQHTLAAILRALPRRIELMHPTIGRMALYFCHPLLRGDMVLLSSVTGVPFMGGKSPCLMCLLPVERFGMAEIGLARTVDAFDSMTADERRTSGLCEVNADEGHPLACFAGEHSLLFDVFSGIGLVDRLHNLDLGIGRYLVLLAMEHVANAASLHAQLKCFRFPTPERYARIPTFRDGDHMRDRAAAMSGAKVHGLLVFLLFTVSGDKVDLYYAWESKEQAGAFQLAVRSYLLMWQLLSSPPNEAADRAAYLQHLDAASEELHTRALAVCPERAARVRKLHALLHVRQLVELYGSAQLFAVDAGERLHRDFAKHPFNGVAHRGNVALPLRLLRWVRRQMIVRHGSFISEDFRQALHASLRPARGLVGVAGTVDPEITVGAAKPASVDNELWAWLVESLPGFRIALPKSAVVGPLGSTTRVRADKDFLRMGERYSAMCLSRGAEGCTFGIIRACVVFRSGDLAGRSALVLETLPALVVEVREGKNVFALHKTLRVIGLVRFCVGKRQFLLVPDNDFENCFAAHFVPALQPCLLSQFDGAPADLPEALTTRGAQLVRCVYGLEDRHLCPISDVHVHH